MIYDYIVVGSGMGGIAAGLNLASNDKKVLILEKNSLPGGLVTTFKRGRFEFDTTLHTLANYGDEEITGDLKKILDKWEIDVPTVRIPLDIEIKEVSSKKDFIIKGEAEDIIVQLEEEYPGSMEKLKKLLKIVKEIHEALKVLLDKGKVEENEYPNFYKFVDLMAIDGLNLLGLKREVINKLSFVWLNLGSPLNKLSFIDYAEYMYKLIFKKEVVLTCKSLEFVLNMINKYQSMGGKILYNSNVIEVTKENNLMILKTEDGLIYKAKEVVFDVSKRYVFKELIKDAAKDIKKLENARTIGANGVIVYLGLNKSYQELGLKHHKYLLVDNLSSDINVKYMMNKNHNTIMGIVPNVVNIDASPKNTTILVLEKMFFKDIFKNINKYDYQKFKEDMAKEMINSFEENLGIDITEYIEEIEIATPFTIERYTNNINGSWFGYMRKGYDNSINRILAYPDEVMDKISFVGGSSLFASGVDNAFYSGIYVTQDKLNREVKHG